MDGIQFVGVGEKEHLRKIQRHVQVMIPEGVVLLWIQDLQQGRGRVPAHVAADFVHLVQHDHRVHGFHLVQGLDDTARHGAHIGSAVTADFAFVMHAAQ